MLNLKKSPELKLVIVIAVLFWVLASTLVLQRYLGFYATYVSFDQGIFNQVFWNSLHGQFFQSSLSSTLSAAAAQDGNVPEVFYHRLGQHFTPALMLWLPIYAIFPSPITLALLQSTLITVAGLVLYALARQYHPAALSAMLTASFYSTNAVVGPVLANFSDFCQLPLFIFGLLLALEKRWWWLFGILAVLTLAVREDAGVVLFSIGFYLVLSRRHPQVGLGVCTLSLAYMLVLTNLVMPLFSEDISRRFMIEQFGHFVDSNEASTLEVIWSIVSNPRQLVVELLQPFDQTLNYLLGQWLPLAFVPVISPAAWVSAGFPLLQTLMRQDPIALTLSLRYALTIVPGLFYGAILWWSQHPTLFQRSFRRFWTFCIILALVFTFTSNPNRALSFVVPDSFQPLVYVPPNRQWQHVNHIRSFLAQIPPDASVSATSHIVPHLSSRREIVRFPSLQLRNDDREVISAEYVVVDLWQLQQYQVVFDDDRAKLRELVPVIDQILGNQEYGLVGYQNGVLFLRRGATSEPTAVAAWQTYRQELEPILTPT